MKNIFLLAIATLLLAGSAVAADIKIIANPGVSAASLSGEELKRLFLMTRASFDDGTRAEPVLLKGGPGHEAFLKEYLGKTDAALQTYYRSLVFTGKGSMPKVLASDGEVIAYVAKTHGAIGYVSAGTSVSGAKTIEVK